MIILEILLIIGSYLIADSGRFLGISQFLQMKSMKVSKQIG